MSGACLEDEEFGVAVMKTIVEKVQIVGMPRDNVSKKGGGKGVGTKRLSKKADSSGDFFSEWSGGTRDGS